MKAAAIYIEYHKRFTRQRLAVIVAMDVAKPTATVAGARWTKWKA